MASVKDLAIIQLSNGVRLGVNLDSPPVVFNLPQIEGIFSDSGRIFKDTDPGPSEVHAEEIASLVEKLLGQPLSTGGLVACHFTQDRIGRVKSDYVARWTFTQGFDATRLSQDFPVVQRVRDCLLLNEAAPTPGHGSLMTTRSFSSRGHLFGVIGENGYSGMLHFNGASIALAQGRSSLAALAKPESYDVIGGGNSLLQLPGLGLTLSPEETSALQTCATHALDELDLYTQRNHPVRRTDLAIPELVRFLQSAAQTQICSAQEVPSGPSWRDSVDDLSRLKDTVEVVVLASGAPFVPAIFLAGVYAVKSLLSLTDRQRQKGDRP